MKQYIDKIALITEIERRIKEIDEIGTYLSPKGVLTNLLCHINALKVKEVDLEKEIKKYIENNICGYCVPGVEETAKYFFELGLKARQGE